MNENINRLMSMIPFGVVLVLFLVALYFITLTTCILTGIPYIITTADSTLIVLISVLTLLYIFRRREAKKDVEARIDE